MAHLWPSAFHFCKCVVLPQGRFAEFLHDRPEARQELLVELQHYEPARSRLSCQVDFTPALDGLRLTVAPDE